jgi:hypothetical protein
METMSKNDWRIKTPIQKRLWGYFPESLLNELKGALKPLLACFCIKGISPPLRWGGMFSHVL